MVRKARRAPFRCCILIQMFNSATARKKTGELGTVRAANPQLAYFARKPNFRSRRGLPLPFLGGGLSSGKSPDGSLSSSSSLSSYLFMLSAPGVRPFSAPSPGCLFTCTPGVWGESTGRLSYLFGLPATGFRPFSVPAQPSESNGQVLRGVDPVPLTDTPLVSATGAPMTPSADK